MATQTRAPTSDNSTAGTVAYSSGTTGYNLVNDYPDTADPLTSYVTLGTTANSAILFNFSAFTLPATAHSISVAVQYYDEEPSSGANTSDARILVGGTQYSSGTTHNPSTTTTARSKTFANNPKTGAAWTYQQINGTDGTNDLQAFGVIGPDSNPVWRLGAIQCVVTYSVNELDQTTTFTGAPAFYAATVVDPGRVYYVIGPSSGWSAPSATQVKAGQLGGGGSATASGYQTSPLVTTDPFTFSAAATGLTASTTYKIAFVWNKASSDSNVAVSSDFNTTGASNQTLTAGLFSASPTFYTHTLTSAITLPQGSRFDGAPGYYTATLAASITLPQATTFAGAPTFHAAALTSAVTLPQATRFDGAPGYYVATVSTTVTLPQATRFDAPPTFYTHTLDQGAAPQTLTQASRFDAAPVFYDSPITTTVTLTAGLFEGAPGFYTHTLTQGGAPQELTAGLFTGTPGYFTHTLSTGAAPLTQGTTFANQPAFYAATVETDVARIYYVIGPNAGWSDPSAAQIKAGQLGGGGGATAAGSEVSPVVTTNPFTFSAAATGLSSGTQYKIAFVWSDSTTDSNVAVSSTFQTTGTQTLTQTSTFVNAPTYYAATVTQSGPQTLTQSSTLSGAPAFYAATITQQDVLIVYWLEVQEQQNLTTGLFTGAPGFYAATVSQGAAPQTLTQSSTFAGAPAFYAATLTPGAAPLTQVSRFDGVPAYYAATVSQGGALQTLTQASIFTGVPAFYVATVSAAITLPQAARFDNVSTFYAATLTTAGGIAQATRFDNAPVFYVATLTPEAAPLTQNSRFDGAPTFYAASLTLQQFLTAGRFDSVPQFYAAVVSAGSAVLDQATRFDGAPGFYTSTLSPGSVTLTAARFDNAPTFQSATVTAGPGSLAQADRFDNDPIIYGPLVSHSIAQSSRFDGTPVFYPPVVYIGSDGVTRVYPVNAENRLHTVVAENRSASFSTELRERNF